VPVVAWELRVLRRVGPHSGESVEWMLTPVDGGA